MATAARPAPRGDLDAYTAGGTGPASATAADAVLCVDGDRSWVVELPPEGAVVVGRGPDAGIALGDRQVSRAHLRLEISAAGLTACDLGSRHGTQVNGEPLVAARSLHSGDVIAAGGAVLVVRRAARPVGGAGAGFDRRLAEELARAERRDGELALVVVRVDADRAAVDAWLAARLALTEHAAIIDELHVAVVLPELDAGDAAARAGELIAGTPYAAGVATAPHDAVAADLLLLAARTAAGGAARGRVGRAADAVEQLALGPHTAVIADAGMAQVYALARRLARTDVPVTIHGETGAGKELIARALHEGSRRAAGPFVAINCAAIPDGLAEAELFGHARGAFTGAVAARAGHLEAASGGTLFLDEIAELTPAMQARLLRALECGEVRRLGENTPRAIDVRVVSASLRRLRDEVGAGRFRQDLFFRLGTAQLDVPPLRDRPRDLAALIPRFVAAACARIGRRPLAVAAATARALAARRWAGNIRELRHVIDFAVATAPDEVRALAPWHLPPDEPPPPPAVAAVGAPPPVAVRRGFAPIAEELEALERRRMVEALRAAAGVQVKAAELIAMPMRTFATKLRRYAIEADEWETP